MILTADVVKWRIYRYQWTGISGFDESGMTFGGGCALEELLA